MKKKKFIIIVIFLFIFNLVQQGFAQQPIYVGIPRANFNFFASSQRNSEWCWAASLQMIFNYYGISITQEQIVARSYGVGPGGSLPNWAGSLQIITTNLNNWSVDNNGRRYVVRASINWGAPSPLFLIQELTAQRPVLIGYKSGPGSSHAVVITGCSYLQTGNGPFIQSIIVRDPWPNQENIINSGRVEYPAINLASVIQANWFISIQ